MVIEEVYNISHLGDTVVANPRASMPDSSKESENKEEENFSQSLVNGCMQKQKNDSFSERPLIGEKPNKTEHISSPGYGIATEKTEDVLIEVASDKISGAVSNNEESNKEKQMK